MEGSKKKSNLSPEGRQKLSELAKQRHKEGKLGGKKYGNLGGRPKHRQDRVAKRVAEAAQDESNAKAIIKVFQDAVKNDKPINTRLKGAQAWLDIEHQEAKVAIQEEEANAKQHSREELIQILAEKLTAGPTAEIIKRQLSGKAPEVVIDAEVFDE